MPELAQEQDVWLDQELEDSVTKGYKYIIVFQHIPWFLRTPTEEKEYFNIDTELRINMLKKFNNCGEKFENKLELSLKKIPELILFLNLTLSGVQGIFCGHYHRNAGGFFQKMELVVTSAIGAQMGNDKSGMRVVKMLEDGFKHEYYDVNNVPENINLS